MKIFIDSANMADIKAAVALGVIDGCTTNPTHIAKAIKETGKSYEDIIREICDVVDGPISAEALSTNAEELVPEARKLAKIHERVVVKVPMNDEGLKSVNILSKEGIKTNVTLIFSANQALMAAKAGAAFVSPFVMRLDKIGQIGMQLIEEIVQIFDNYDTITTEIIAASITNPRWVTDCALAGAHIATIPYVTFAELSKHPMTDLGIAQFLKDWNTENA